MVSFLVWFIPNSSWLHINRMPNALCVSMLPILPCISKEDFIAMDDSSLNINTHIHYSH